MSHWSEIVEGDRVEVFDWHPSIERSKWQIATVVDVNDYEMLVDLDDYPGDALTCVPIRSNAWRLPR